MLFAPDINWNLVSVLVLIKLDFELRFHGQGVDLFLEQQYYGYGYFFDGFIVLDVEHGEALTVFLILHNLLTMTIM